MYPSLKEISRRMKMRKLMKEEDLSENVLAAIEILTEKDPSGVTVGDVAKYIDPKREIYLGNTTKVAPWYSIIRKEILVLYNLGILEDQIGGGKRYFRCKNILNKNTINIAELPIATVENTKIKSYNKEWYELYINEKQLKPISYNKIRNEFIYLGNIIGIKSNGEINETDFAKIFNCKYSNETKLKLASKLSFIKGKYDKNKEKEKIVIKKPDQMERILEKLKVLEKENRYFKSKIEEIGKPKAKKWWQF
jgi:hypothetical protein